MEAIEIIENNPTTNPAQLYVELWVSLASLLRSYTAAHGLNGNRQATVELGEERILVRHGDDWLDLNRKGPEVTWRREDGRQGKLEFTEHGRLRKEGLGEEEMDMAAERWARELMTREKQQ
ncbi:MAG: transcriptional regulator [Terracidiphilus sp.]